MSKIRPNAPATQQELEAAQAHIDRLEADLEQFRLKAQAAERKTRCFRELAEHIREVFWMTNPLGDQYSAHARPR